MKANARAIDRVMPPEIGGYPVNYGFVPQTVSYDGDPFDVLVLGPALPGGKLVPGVIVGVMFMEDEKGLDSKVVTSPVDASGRPRYSLSPADRKRIGGYFARYKLHEPGKFSKVPGWDRRPTAWRMCRRHTRFFASAPRSPGDACYAYSVVGALMFLLAFLRDDARGLSLFISRSSKFDRFDPRGHCCPRRGRTR